MGNILARQPVNKHQLIGEGTGELVSVEHQLGEEWQLDTGTSGAAITLPSQAGAITLLS